MSDMSGKEATCLFFAFDITWPVIELVIFHVWNRRLDDKIVGAMRRTMHSIFIDYFNPKYQVNVIFNFASNTKKT